MASGGMDWAYRMIAAGGLDPLGVAIVLHLGWRDAANQRTDRGIAAALGQHRSSVQKATAKLCEAGVIVRRSGQWVAAETVAIVEERPDARRPDATVRDGVAHSVGRTTQWAGGGPLSGPQVAHSVGPKRKENIEKGARVEKSRVAGRSAVQRDAAKRPATGEARIAENGASGRGALEGLTAFQLERIRMGRSVVLAGQTVREGSAEMAALQAKLRGRYEEA